MARVRVKICGVTTLPDALLAAELGADAVGFVFYARSPRAIDPERAREIARALPPFVTRVGVFARLSAAEAAPLAERAGMHLMQLHDAPAGEIPPAWEGRLLPAFRVGAESPADTLEAIRRSGAGAFLLDAAVAGLEGGTGRTFDWTFAREAGKLGRVIVAGGLNPANVARAIAAARPYGVDVASGVEAGPGRKDPALLEQFIEAVREASAARPALGGGR